MFLTCRYKLIKFPRIVIQSPSDGATGRLRVGRASFVDMTHRISRDDPLYAELIELVAEHPGSDIHELMKKLDGEHDRETVQEELQLALNLEDLTVADDKYWVMRYDGPPE